MDALYAGEVGYLAASIKAVADARVGDTITLKCARRTARAPGPSALWSSRCFRFPQHACHEYCLFQVNEILDNNSSWLVLEYMECAEQTYSL